MELDTALKLLEKGISETDNIQTWADLGAGSGLFTTALAKLLPHGSSIIAIDKKLSKIASSNGVDIQARTGDFLDLDFGKVDGVVMANSLHYVKDQQAFLQRLATKTSRLVLVEYDTDRANQWVPYPVSFNKLRSYRPNAKQIGEEGSLYHKEGMYSALVLF